jgi:uncharacterized protein YbjQ (UPF0145 family)
MRISATDTIDGGRIVYPIGKIKAASGWHAQSDEYQTDWRELALRELIRRAEDVDADAIIDVNFEIDGVLPVDGFVNLSRVLAAGTAVKLGVAA